MATKNINKSFTKTPMAELGIEDRIGVFDEVALGYTEEEAYAEAKRCAHCKAPGCRQQCPAHNNIPGFIACIVEKDYAGAYRILRQTSAFPGVCSRVCAQELQCESGCLRGRNGFEPVAIGRLERFVADWAAAHPDEVAEAEAQDVLAGVKVAVVGAGPAGIACADDLLALGADVTVLEAKEEAGGILAYGIPEFVLPKAVVAGYVSGIEARGAKVRLGERVGDASALLTDGGFDAVFLAHGAEAPRRLGCEGEGLTGFWDSADFLAAAAVDPASISAGRKCIVIGGGNTAIDVARTARRLGADVTVVYRRSLAEMPARAEEVKHAQEEGVAFEMLASQKRILGNGDGHVAGLECVRMELGEPDASGRRSPVPVEGSEFVLDADCVVSAAGSVADPALPGSVEGLDTDSRGYIAADRYVSMTSVPGVFSGGDAVTGPATVVAAMVAGKHAAKGIRRYIFNREHPHYLAAEEA